LVAAERLAGGSGRIQGIGLGAVAASGPLGPVQLHHPLSVAMEEPGQAGAVAAGALDRPDSFTLVAGHQLKQPLVAGWGGRHGQLLDHRAGGRDHDRRGVGVLVVSTPTTSSTRPASMAMR
jgi:hypothetical protein